MGKIKWVIAGLLLVFIASTGEARVYLDVYGKAFKRITIGAPTFKSDTAGRLKTEMTDLLNKDLDFSGFFVVAPQSLFDSELMNEGVEKQEIKFGNWRSIGVELLCKARLQEKGGEIVLEAFVYDTIDGALMLYKRYKAGPEEWRGVVHKLANAIILAATGEKGILESKVLFVSGSRFHKELYIADIDGTNARKITNYRSITLSPSVSPNGRYMAFTSYKEGRPNLYVMDLSAKREIRTEKGEGMKIGTNWLGKSLFGFSHTSGKISTIYSLNVESGEKSVLLRKDGILASPSFSPDGSKMVFVSDMYGHPQIFIKNMGSGEAKRLTYSGKYNTSPVFSPKGDLIAFVSQLEGSFEICTMNSDGSNQRVLTNGHGAVNDSPQFSPCGRYIIYSSRSGGKSSINIMLFNGENRRRIKFTDGEEDQPKFMP